MPDYKYKDFQNYIINITGYSSDGRDTTNALYCEENVAIEQRE
jgi:hypothetical protein